MHAHTVSTGPFTRWEDMARRALRLLLPGIAAASLLVTGLAQAAPIPPLPLPPPLGPAPAEPAPQTPAPPPPADPASYATEIVTLTNSERETAGCVPLDVDDRLTAAAQLHAEDMAEHGKMDHVGSNGSTFDERIRDQGHPKPGAENVARGYPDAATTVREWMASPGHRRNIVNCTYVTVGVGFDPRGNFVAQEFGRPE